MTDIGSGPLTLKFVGLRPIICLTAFSSGGVKEDKTMEESRAGTDGLALD